MTDLKAWMAQGLSMRSAVFGDADAEAWQQTNAAFDPDFNLLMLGLRWGMITSRPGLDIRTRQLCALATFLTLGDYEEVFIDHQIEGALRAGATPQEVVEVILQTGLFAGLYKWAVRKRAMRIFTAMGYTQGVDWAASAPTTETDLRALAARGRELRRQVFGDDAPLQADTDELDPVFNDLILGLRWGMIAARPALDLRARQLCALATLLVRGEADGANIERQMRGALRCGATPQEIVEVILQTGLFAGLDRWAAGRVALRVFRDMGYTHGVDWGVAAPSPG